MGLTSIGVILQLPNYCGDGADAQVWSWGSPQERALPTKLLKIRTSQITTELCYWSHLWFWGLHVLAVLPRKFGIISVLPTSRSQPPNMLMCIVLERVA